MTTNTVNDRVNADVHMDDRNRDRDRIITYNPDAARNYIDLIYSYYISQSECVYYDDADMEILSKMKKAREELFSQKVK